MLLMTLMTARLQVKDIIWHGNHPSLLRRRVTFEENINDPGTHTILYAVDRYPSAVS